MNPRIEELKQRMRSGEHKKWRQSSPINILSECEAENLSWSKRMARLTRRQCESELVAIEPNERIVFTRTLPEEIAPIYSPKDWKKILDGHNLRGRGPISNVCADWGKVLQQGLTKKLSIAVANRDKYHNDPEAIEFLDGAIETINAVKRIKQELPEVKTVLGVSNISFGLDVYPRRVLNSVFVNRQSDHRRAVTFRHWQYFRRPLLAVF